MVTEKFKKLASSGVLIIFDDFMLPRVLNRKNLAVQTVCRYIVTHPENSRIIFLLSGMFTDDRELNNFRRMISTEQKPKDISVGMTYHS